MKFPKLASNLLSSFNNPVWKLLCFGFSYLTSYFYDDSKEAKGKGEKESIRNKLLFVARLKSSGDDGVRAR